MKERNGQTNNAFEKEADILAAIKEIRQVKEKDVNALQLGAIKKEVEALVGSEFIAEEIQSKLKNFVAKEFNQNNHGTWRVLVEKSKISFFYTGISDSHVDFEVVTE